MSKAIERRGLRRAISLLALVSLGAGFLISAPAAATGKSALVKGATVKADRHSPTGYTVRFVYHNPHATQVRLAGDLTLLDVDTGTTRYQPEAWQPGRYHAGGTEFLRDMTRDARGYWSVSVPLHAGGLSYWYRVWDPTRGWVNKRIWDPASRKPRPPGESSFRVRNNDVLDAVYVPYARKQNDPVPKERADYDETDFMVPANVPNILDTMTARGEIEPTVVVTMGNHFTGTSLDFASYNQTNAANNLVRTILPLVEARYNVSTERTERAYAGFSYGGMTAGQLFTIFARDHLWSGSTPGR